MFRDLEPTNPLRDTHRLFRGHVTPYQRLDRGVSPPRPPLPSAPMGCILDLWDVEMLCQPHGRVQAVFPEDSPSSVDLVEAVYRAVRNVLMHDP